MLDCYSVIHTRYLIVGRFFDHIYISVLELHYEKFQNFLKTIGVYIIDNN